MLLLLTFLYEEVWEFLIFILSSRLMVSLLCEYTAKRHLCERRLITRLICHILWVRRKLSRPTLSFMQLSLLSFSGHLPSSMALLPRKKATVAIEVKKSIVQYLVAHVIDGDGDAAAPLSNGWSTLWSEKHCSSRHLIKACESKSHTEVILPGTSPPAC
jgi:hypothetical protein